MVSTTHSKNSGRLSPTPPTSHSTRDRNNTETKDLQHSMPSILPSYRETEPTNSATTSRYLPSDFPILTNRTFSSPLFTPDFAHEPHAECISNGRTATTADKRAISLQAASYSLYEAQGSRCNRDITHIRWSSVKEEEGGKSQAFPHPNKLPVCLAIT